MLVSAAIIALLAVAAVGADWLLKIASSKSNPYFTSQTMLAAVIYGATAFGWVHVMKTVKLATIGAIFSMTTLLFMVLLGTLVFGERLNLMECLGLIFAVASVCILSHYT